MFARLLIIFLPVAFGAVALNTISAGALGGNINGIVIAQVQAGAANAAPNGDAAATQEFISIYNNSDAPVDITNWCVANKTASFACFTPPSFTTLALAPHSYATVDSDSFETRYKAGADVTFITTNKTSGSLTGGSDTVTLLDANGSAVDSIGWTASLAGGSVLVRSAGNSGTLTDTDSATDFKKLTTLTVPQSGVTETTHIVDECANLDGVQQTIPDGYGQLADGSCVLDACPNLSGLQDGVPADMILDTSGHCVLVMPHLDLTELLPNASGSDDGNEFVELYNPNETDVSLANYRLQIGQNFEKTYAFPAGSSIGAGQYLAFSNAGIPFSLLNTSSRVRLASVDGQTISETPLYTDPADDEAWAFIDDAWMFTNQPTPGLPNLLPVDEPDAGVTVASGLKPCASNQYRNPDTNRCRVVETSASATPCKDGQYRSEETNRCRSIANDASTAKACADDQFRNPDTGRCKKIASEDEVAPCPAGKERNAVTNRCRSVVASGANIGSGVKLVAAPAASVFGWWAAEIVGVVALGYAALEWRRDIGRWLAPRFAWAAPFIRPITALYARLRKRTV